MAETKRIFSDDPSEESDESDDQIRNGDPFSDESDDDDDVANDQIRSGIDLNDF